MARTSRGAPKSRSVAGPTLPPDPVSPLRCEGMDRIHGVFEGGGIKGIALAGAAAGTMRSGYRFVDVAGTSAGALVASLVAAGYDAAELRACVCRVPWRSLLDPGPEMRFPGLGRHLALFRRRARYKGDRLEEVWSELLADKGVHTFGDLRPGSLRMVATDLTHEVGVALPEGLAAYGIDPGRFPVARAVRMSAAVPFVYEPVPVVDQRNGEEVLFGDGALASKFPVELVDQTGAISVVGYRLVNIDEPHAHNTIRGPASLAAAVMGAGMRARESLPTGRFEHVEQVAVPACRDPLDFDISGEEARAMFDGGHDAAVAHFATTPLSS